MKTNPKLNAAQRELRASIARHSRYSDVESQLANMDRDANPVLVCELEIELVWLAERIAEEAK